MFYDSVYTMVPLLETSGPYTTIAPPQTPSTNSPTFIPHHVRARNRDLFKGAVENIEFKIPPTGIGTTMEEYFKSAISIEDLKSATKMIVNMSESDVVAMLVTSEDVGDASKLTSGKAADYEKYGRMKGIDIACPFDVFEESPPYRLAPLVRIEKMLESILSNPPEALKFLLALPPEKNYILYGPWKMKNLAKYGIITRSIASTIEKLELSIEYFPSMALVSKDPITILGMDVSHGSPGQFDVPLIVADVSSM